MGKIITDNNYDIYSEIDKIKIQKIDIVKLSTDLYQVDNLHTLNNTKAQLICNELNEIYQPEANVEKIIQVSSGILYTGLLKLINNSDGLYIGLFLFSYNATGPYFIIKYPSLNQVQLYALSKNQVTS